MKKLIFGILIILSLASCEDERCASCIAESISGNILQYTIECEQYKGFLDGYVEGLRDYYKDHGDTVEVRCIYFN